MQLPETAALLRIFVGENDHAGDRPLYEEIVLRARSAHLAGATVLRGQIGFGRSSVLHRASLMHLSQDLPFVVEIVDDRRKIEAFLPELEPIIGSCLMTIEEVTVVRYGADASGLAEDTIG